MSAMRIGLVGVLLAGAVSAQSAVVVPVGLESVEGGGLVYAPTGRAPARSQFVYGRRVLPAAPGLIQSFKIRRDGDYTSSFQAHSALTEIWMSNNDFEPGPAYSGIFARNRGSDFTQVMQPRTIIYPVLPRPVQAPAPFSEEFVLDTPFNWKGGPLLVEFVVHGESVVSRRWYPDAEVYAWSGQPAGGSRTYTGSACPQDFRNQGVMPRIGQELYHFGYTQIVGRKALAMDMIGLSGVGLGPVTLPFDLGPLGAPGCTLFTAPVMAVAGVVDETSSTGYVRFDWGFIPNDPALIGAIYQNQQLVVDPGFNALGMRFSRLADCQIGTGITGAPACLHISGYGQNFSLNSPAASLIEARGLVMQWTW